MEAIMTNKITIRCACGKEVILVIVGGQYQDEYRGNCDCGCEWFLKELSETFAEISDDT